MSRLSHRLLTTVWKTAMPIWLTLLVLGALGIELTPGDGGRVAAVWGLALLGIGTITYQIDQSPTGLDRMTAKKANT